MDTRDSGGETKQMQQQQQQQQSRFGTRDMIRMIVMFTIVHFGIRKLMSSSAPHPIAKTTSQDSRTNAKKGGRNLWRDGQAFDLHVYISEIESFDHEGAERNANQLVWKERGLRYSCAEGAMDRTKALNVSLPSEVRVENASAFAHVFLAKRGATIDERDSRYRKTSVVYRRFPVTKYVTRKRKIETRNLLSDSSDKDVEDVADNNAANKSYADNRWIPTLHLNFVHDFSLITRDNPLLPQAVKSEVRYDDTSGNYHPSLYRNDLLLIEDHLIPLNGSTQLVPLEMTFGCISMFKWQLHLQMADTWRRQSESGLASGLDDMKRMIAETNPYLLAFTGAVTVLHMLFDCLAFKNDVQFWRNRKSLRGMSLRSLVMRIFFQVVIFLYLLDSEQTSKMILFSRGVGLAIEVWKLKKVVKLKLQPDAFPFVRIETEMSYVKSKTKRFDDVAMSHLLYIIYPGVVGYALYALKTQEFKSWYSFVISSLVGFIYVFGFVLMTPQLFLNYKLKSTAHMNWKSLVYRSLNTFVDDLYALIIPMPILHRLACLRDDVIFFIFLYQRWVYTTRRRRDGPDGASSTMVTTNDCGNGDCVGGGGGGVETREKAE